MNKAFFGKVLLAMLCLVLISVCQAKDTAMVTQIEGNGIKARIEKSSWQPSLGEILPASVSIEIAAGSLLGLLHLAANSELTVRGPKNITIMEDRFEGVDAGEAKKVETFASKLDLDSRSLTMVGAVSSDKISYGSGGDKGFDKGAFDKSKDISKANDFDYKKNKTVEFPDTTIEGNLAKPSDAQIAEVQAQQAQKEAAEAKLAAMQKQLEALESAKAQSSQMEIMNKSIGGLPGGSGGSSGSSNEPKPEKNHEEKTFQIGGASKFQKGSGTIWLGIPNSITSKFGKSDRMKLFDGEESLSSVNLHREAIPSTVKDWTLYSCDAGKLENNATLFLGEKPAATNLEIRIFSTGEKEPSVMSALMHESNQRFEQAAGIWLKLADGKKVTPKVLKGHLDRVMAKMQAR